MMAVQGRSGRIVVGVTGASGAVYARRLIECLCQAGVEVHLVLSPHGQRLLHDELLYQRVARQAVTWNTAHGNCGLVVGATRAETLRDVRALAPDLPLLIPGVGAQGGDLEATVTHARDAAGGGYVINASRSVLYASADADYADAARAVAEAMRADINRLRHAAGP